MRLPLAVKRSVGAVPAPIVRTVSGDAGFFDIAVNGMNTLPDARFAGSRLATPVIVTSALVEDPTTDPYDLRSEEHTSELQPLMRISYAVFCLKKNNTIHQIICFQHTRPTLISKIANISV